MELHYDITKQDFIDFNLNYYNNNAIVQRSIRTMRIATAAIVILGGQCAHVLAAYAHAGFPSRFTLRSLPSASGAHRAICVIK